DFVYLQFTDILGSVKGITIPTSRLERAFDEGVWFDGSSVEGWARTAESDLYLRPAPTSLALFPWQSPPAARFICDLSLPSGAGSRPLEQCGCSVAATPHAVAPGQHEIDLAEHDALRAADAIATLKIALRAFGQRENLLATFMPKPLGGLSGSGLHFQQALF